ncbi:glycosyltransferase family 4 protein [Aerococcaceae bacterium DSM 111021]|nr:glycosyltransferase family 4 protein [Aerococcaceae bacterium DSM 111021]
MRIGMFTDTYFPQVSGVSTSIKILCDQLRKVGHEVIIFTTSDPDARPENGVVRLPSIPFASFEDRRIAYGGLDRCLKISREYDLDIIHTHTEFSLGLAGKYVASRLKIPTVHTYHTMYENYTHYIWNGRLIKRQHVRWFSKAFCGQADGVITPSELTYATLKDYGVEAPMRIIPTGVLLPKFNENYRSLIRQRLNIPMDAPVLLSLSRLSKEKSLDEVLMAFPSVQEAYPSTHLVIVGDGPYRETLETIAKGYELKNVHFIGEILHNEVNQYYQMADLYINASESESQGLTYLESIANRLPLVAKENDYLNLIIQSGEFGQLYAPNGSLDKAIINYLDKKYGGEIESINLDLLDSISAERFADNVYFFYEELIENSDHTRSNFFERMLGEVKESWSNS